MKPQLPAGQVESARLAELHRLRILDTDPEADFELVAQAAAKLFNAPIALVSLVDGHRQWFKTARGLDIRETHRDHSFCAEAIKNPGRVMIVPDARVDERFARNVLVTGAPGIRFYAGAPLVSSSGHALGTLCVIDRLPRVPNDGEIAALAALALLATRLIERRIELDESGRAMSLADPDDTSRIAVFGWDTNARIISWSRAAQAAFGWTASEVLGTFPPFVLPNDAQRYRDDCMTSLQDSGDAMRLCALRTKSGEILQVALATTRAVASDGTIHGLTMVENFGARIATRRRLAMLESVVVNSIDAVVVTEEVPDRDPARANVEQRIVYVNAAFTRMTGYTSDEAIGRTPGMLHGPLTDRHVLAQVSSSLRRREPVAAEVTNYRKDGTTFQIEFSIAPVKDPDGKCMYFVATQRDTTLRRALETYEIARAVVLEMAIRNEPLERQLARIVMLLNEVIPGSMASVMLLRGDRLFCGAADPRIPAAYLAAIEGVQIGPAVGSCGTAAFTGAKVICGDIATDAPWRAYRDVALRAGLRACWSMPMSGTDGSVIGVLSLYADRAVLPAPKELQVLEETVRFASLVIERHRDRERLERMAFHDALTELPNRKYFELRCETALARARAAGDGLALGIIDIDRFKAINDAFGHHVGDELLRSIAARLSLALRDGDVIARMAGDEFLLLLTDVADRSDGIAAARRLLAQFEAAFSVGGYELFVRPSLGLAFFPETSMQMPGLFQAADKAMYTAKTRGGGLELATSPEAGSALRKLDLETDLRHALERGEFMLHYQMMFGLADGRPVGAEALLRWNHPRLGVIAPDDFIPLAEANGTIVAIGTWVIGEASRLARSWSDAGHDAFVTVNVSPLQFDEPGLVATIVEALERHGLEPHRLHLELTESIVMRNPQASAAMMLQLKALGVRIVIDDFGTGYSSLAYLQRFAFDSLKIDRAFVSGIGNASPSGRSERIVEAVIALGQALGVTTIAEGVETDAQYEFIRSCGCTVVQGYLCARPVVAQDLVWEGWESATPVAFG